MQGAPAVEGVAAESSCSGGRGCMELLQRRAWLQGAPAVEGVAAGSSCSGGRGCRSHSFSKTGHIRTTNFVRYTEMSVAQRVQRSRAYLMS